MRPNTTHTFVVAPLALMIALCFVAAGDATSEARSAYSLDGINLGSDIRDLIATRGTPSGQDANHYTWANAAGGTVTVTTDHSGAITIIDVRAGPDEFRPLQIPSVRPGLTVQLGATFHMNYDQPPEAKVDRLCGGFTGEPCESFSLSNGAALIVNFGKKVGDLADWSMSEVILGKRSVLVACSSARYEHC